MIAKAASPIQIEDGFGRRTKRCSGTRGALHQAACLVSSSIVSSIVRARSPGPLSCVRLALLSIWPSYDNSHLPRRAGRSPVPRIRCWLLVSSSQRRSTWASPSTRLNLDESQLRWVELFFSERLPGSVFDTRCYGSLLGRRSILCGTWDCTLLEAGRPFRLMGTH